MKQSGKLSIFELAGGVYSARKVPRWHARPHEWVDYQELLQEDWEDAAFWPQPA